MARVYYYAKRDAEDRPVYNVRYHCVENVYSHEVVFA